MSQKCWCTSSRSVCASSISGMERFKLSSTSTSRSNAASSLRSSAPRDVESRRFFGPSIASTSGSDTCAPMGSWKSWERTFWTRTSSSRSFENKWAWSSNGRTPCRFPFETNILFGHDLHRSPDRKSSRQQTEEIVEQALRKVVLWDAVKDRLQGSATELSLEEQQKLCIAWLIPVKPVVLLMDEPSCSAARSEGDGSRRGAHLGAQGRVHDPARHPQHGASPPCQ